MLYSAKWDIGRTSITYLSFTLASYSVSANDYIGTSYWKWE